ncbi:MAG TPA: hypothetical protein VE685_02970 [Thermoanaerobaculia bacterium]|nr:hypothetical protein [Thermoanaerobaculia bacterium]
MKKLCKLVFCVAAFLAAYAFPVDQAVAACNRGPYSSTGPADCEAKCLRIAGCCSGWFEAATSCCYCSPYC